MSSLVEQHPQTLPWKIGWEFTGKAVLAVALLISATTAMTATQAAVLASLGISDPDLLISLLN